MQFESREALINYEKEREEYYRNWFEISNKNLFEFYKLMFLETFHPKYRDIKKKYENYDGGWYRKGNNLIFATIFIKGTHDISLYYVVVSGITGMWISDKTVDFYKWLRKGAE